MRARAELDILRERLTCAQRVFDEYTIARQVRRREAELAWARLSHEAAFAMRDEAHAGTAGQPSSKPLGFETPALPPTRAEASVAPAFEPVGGTPACSRGSGRLQRPFFGFLVMVIGASLASGGVAHFRLRGMSPLEQQTALTGTAFEATIRPDPHVTLASPATAAGHRVLLSAGDPLVGQVQVAPSLVNALAPGGEAIVTLPGMPVRHVPGTITSVTRIPNRNGHHAVEVRFENPVRYSLAGQPAEIRFVFP